MPFIQHTPESLIARSDSKNPATTCKGITGKGRPCRRDLAPRTKAGVLAIAPVQTSDGQETDAAAFFCWQHKDQAERLVHTSNDANENDNRSTKIISLQQRTSLDTLYERLGILEEEEPIDQRSQKQPPRANAEPKRKPRRPPTWENVEGPVMMVPRKSFPQQPHPASVQRPGPSRRPKKGKPTFFEILCCGAASEDDDYIEVVRHKRRMDQKQDHIHQPSMVQTPSIRPESTTQQSTPAHRQTDQRPDTSQSDRRTQLNGVRPPIPHESSSQTSNLLSVIPKHLDPQVTSQLLTELSKPISSFDEEGYIYIFQLTDQDSPSAPNTPAKATRLLTTETSPRSQAQRPSTGSRRASNVSTTSNRTPEGKLLLKIGRASNVQRRMNEWTRQCNYTLELVRWYPHISSASASASPSPSPGPSPSSRRSHMPSSPLRAGSTPPTARRVSDSPLVRKIPHSHRVERLIHIELADKRVRRACEVCGKEHREWFEIEAGRKGVKAVDEVVKRWVEWDERMQITGWR